LKKNFSLFLISILLSLIIVEVFLDKIFFKKKFKYNHENRFILFEQGDIFRNINNDLFTYYPHKKIRTSLFYYEKEFKKVYDYTVNSNNYGLLQKNDIIKNKPAILFLGDSFTEGQGYGSWIDDFNGIYKSYQIINGGILGTGPQQFLSLEKYISKDIKINHVFFLYLGDDFRRSTYTHSNQQLLCLKNYQLCNGKENFFGYPLSKKNPNNFLHELKIMRSDTKSEISFKKIRRSIKKWFKDLYVINIPIEYLKNKFYKSNNTKIKNNFLAVEKLINKYQDDITFINLKQKQEIFYKKESYETIYAKDFINKRTNRNFNCDFENNLGYFHTFDGHPNKKGYEHLYNCIFQILDKTKIK
jgi:hypothetical protein